MKLTVFNKNHNQIFSLQRKRKNKYGEYAIWVLETVLSVLVTYRLVRGHCAHWSDVFQCRLLNFRDEVIGCERNAASVNRKSNNNNQKMCLNDSYDSSSNSSSSRQLKRIDLKPKTQAFRCEKPICKQVNNASCGIAECAQLIRQSADPTNIHTLTHVHT